MTIAREQLTKAERELSRALAWIAELKAGLVHQETLAALLTAYRMAGLHLHDMLLMAGHERIESELRARGVTPAPDVAAALTDGVALADAERTS